MQSSHTRARPYDLDGCEKARRGCEVIRRARQETFCPARTSIRRTDLRRLTFPLLQIGVEPLSDQPLYRWLEQQGEAFGAPGLEPHWTSSVKDAVGTAYSASSRIWFTCSHGILNEIYHPTIDSAQVRDMEFLVTDGETFAHEEKRDLLTSFEYIHPETLGVRYVNRDPDGRYALTKEIICDPHHCVVLQHVRLEGPRGPAAAAAGCTRCWRRTSTAAARATRRAPWTLPATRCCWPGRTSGRWPWAPACGFSRVSCGFVGTSDGWRDLMEDFAHGLGVRLGHQRQPCPDGRVESGQGRRQTARASLPLAIGIGEGQHTALQKTVSALAMPFEQHRSRFIEQWHRAANPEWLAAKSGDGGKLMRASHNVLLAHEDKTYSGAFVASMSIPWGQVHGDDDLGGYHLVWTRDMVQTAICAAGVRARGDGAPGAGLPGLHAAARRRFCAELLGGRAALLVGRATGRGGVSADPGLAPVEGRRAGRDGDLSLCRAGGGVSGAPCAHYPPGALGRESGLLAFHAGGGDCRAGVRGRDCARPRFDGAGHVS